MSATIPDGCVLLVCGSSHLARPWGCGRLANVRPGLVVHGDAAGAERQAGAFFAKVAPVEIAAAIWSGDGVAAARANNGVMLAHAQVRAQAKGVGVFALVLWDYASQHVIDMLNQLKRAGVPTLILRQLAPDVSAWSEVLREEVDEVAGRWLADVLKPGEVASPEQIAKADAHAEGVVRSAFAWRGATYDAPAVYSVVMI